MSEALGKSPDVIGRRAQLIALCRSLPEAEIQAAGLHHLAFKVRKKIFAYYVYDHHGDGRIALHCKAPPGEQSRLLEENPSRYFVPPYVGAKGWVGLWLDSARVSWTAVKQVVVAAYFMTAPGKLRERSKEGKRYRVGNGRRPSKGMKLTRAASGRRPRPGDVGRCGSISPTRSRTSSRAPSRSRRSSRPTTRQ